MLRACYRSCFVLFLCATLSVSGCYFPLLYYPVRHDASDFEEFHYETEPPCVGLYGGQDVVVCEATVTRQASNEYVVAFKIVSNDNPEQTYLPPRALGDSDVERMLALFGHLRIDPHPGFFCSDPLLGDPGDLEYVFRWDDFELITMGCDQARLDIRQARELRRFLSALVITD